MGYFNVFKDFMTYTMISTIVITGLLCTMNVHVYASEKGSRVVVQPCAMSMVTERYEYTALYEAIDQNDLDALKEVVTLCGSQNLSLNIFYGDKQSPLNEAIMRDFSKGAEVLVKARADVNAQSGMEDMLPLHQAATLDRPVIVEMLLKAGATGAAQALEIARKHNKVKTAEVLYAVVEAEAIKQQDIDINALLTMLKISLTSDSTSHKNGE